MLRFLRIRNLAVIEAVDVEFELGFNVLTGETGAGKSILIEAVSLLLGARSSADLVRTGETMASIEAIFEDNGTELLIRREITSQGRSRSYVDGALATAAHLRELSRRLVELHGQHEHQTLLDPSTHIPLLDAHAGLESEAADVAAAWQQVADAREELERSTMDVRERDARLELIAFQLGEIDRVAPRSGEDEELGVSRQVLASSERIQRLCADSYAELYDSDGAVIATLAGVGKRLAELAEIEPQFVPYAAAGQTLRTQLEDVAWFLRDYGARIDASPEKLQEVETRLALLERLKRKHGGSLDQAIETGARLRREQEQLSDSGQRGEEIARRLEQANVAYLDRARALSARRRAAARGFATAIERLLGELAMARSRFEVRLESVEATPAAWGASGIDRGEFFLSPNPGEDLRPMARVVSGGELSRVMLALKTLAARAGAGRAGDGRMPTLIFDEVDAGISGQVAEVVGQRLAQLGRDTQVLCITHLPQIAALGTTQFLIAKTVASGRTVTSVERLSDPAREDAIGRMIGGSTVSAAVRASARELLQQAKAKGESESPARGESASKRRKKR